MSDFDWLTEPTIDLWAFFRTWNGREAMQEDHADLKLSGGVHDMNRNDPYLPILHGVTQSAKGTLRQMIQGHGTHILLGISKEAREYLKNLAQNVVTALGREPKDFPIAYDVEEALRQRFRGWGANAVVQMSLKHDGKSNLPSTLTSVYMVEPDNILERYALSCMLTYPKTSTIVMPNVSEMESKFPLLFALRETLAREGCYWLGNSGQFFANTTELLEGVYGITVLKQDFEPEVESE